LIGTVKFNPEKTKGLEAACIDFMGLPLDIVNLRAEKYTEKSRNPEIVSL
jgi:hypothetical protein